MFPKTFFKLYTKHLSTKHYNIIQWRHAGLIIRSSNVSISCLPSENLIKIACKEDFQGTPQKVWSHQVSHDT